MQLCGCSILAQVNVSGAAALLIQHHAVVVLVLAMCCDSQEEVNLYHKGINQVGLMVLSDMKHTSLG